MKRRIGQFLRQRREELGWTTYRLRQLTGYNYDQIGKVESGRDSVTTDTLLALMQALGVGMHLTALNSDEAAPVTDAGTTAPPPFLQCTDGDQLYVLHWRHPAFLVQVVQSIPHTLRVVATYGPTPEELKQLPAWGKAETHVKRLMEQGQDLN